MFCFLSIVPKGKTIRNPGRGGKEGGGGGRGKKFPVHEIFFSRSWLQEFFPMWKVYCLDGVLLARIFFGKIPLAGIFFGGIVTPPSRDF